MVDRVVEIDAGKMLLSGRRRAFKTERFISETRRVAMIDAFASRLAERVMLLSLAPDDPERALVATMPDGARAFFMRVDPAPDGNIVFFRCMNARTDATGYDRSIEEAIAKNPKIAVRIREDNETPPKEFKKLYLLAPGRARANFPLLNATQKRIVRTEDSNMLVQGAAGSGKTNVCVEKIVFAATRGYRGKTLYTTFSRGLLNETREKVEQFSDNIDEFLKARAEGRIEYLDGERRTATANKLGVELASNDDEGIARELRGIADYLKNSVDYALIEDLYAARFGEPKIANEKTFATEYAGENGACKTLGALNKLKNVSREIAYKEICGMIFGRRAPDDSREALTKDEYDERRKFGFAKTERDVIYSTAVDYAQFLEKNGYRDSNGMSRALMKSIDKPVYSLGIIDEAQDFTEINLALIRKMCVKLFCVADALQMINPAYFSFAYLKSLMYGEITGVTELRHNYRNSEKIERITSALSEMNRVRFGTHSFVIQSEAVESDADASAVFARSDDFAKRLTDGRFENITAVVASAEKKAKLREKLKRLEILTVSEIKGLERDTILLLDVLSDNIDKWRYLQTMLLDRKKADENSVFRYYFNLFYVGVSRAKRHLFVAEREYPEIFAELFETAFETLGEDEARERLYKQAGEIRVTDAELVDRIEKFCGLEQYDNARFAIERLADEATRAKLRAYASIHEKWLRFGKLREAGIEYWREGMPDEARELFARARDDALISLMDACFGGEKKLDFDIARFYPDILGNEMAEELIRSTLRDDCEAALKAQTEIKDALKRQRGG